MFRACITSSLAVALTLALAGTSSATTFCVAPEASCPGAQTYATLPEALTAATGHAGADKIVLGAATYVAPTTAGFEYNDVAPDGVVEIQGQGASTVLTGPSSATRVLYLHKAAAGSSAHDLAVHIPASAPFFAEGIRSFGIGVSHVTVDAEPGQSNPVLGVVLTGGADLEHSTVTLDTAGSTLNSPVTLQDPNSSITDSSVSGPVGITVTGGGTVDRVRVTARAEGIEADNNIAVLIRNSVVSLVPNPAGQTAIAAVNAPLVTVVNCTLIGNGGSQSVGLLSRAFSNYNGGLDVANTLVHNFGHSLQRAPSGALSASIAIRYSDYDPATVLESGSGAITDGGGNGFHADPGFVDKAGGVYSLRFDSPLVDVGDPVASFGTDDVVAHQRNVDGDAAGGPVPDIGAFEYQRAAPEPKITGPSSGEPGLMLTWGGSAYDLDPGEASQLTYGWQVDGGPLEPGTQLQHVFTTNGTHHVVLVVDDPAGVEGTLDLPVQIGPAGGGGGGSSNSSDNDPPAVTDSTPSGTVSVQSPSSSDPQPPAVGPVDLAPVITRLRVRGRWVRLTVNEAATIDVRIERRSKTAAHLVRHRRVAARKAGALKIRLGHLRLGRYRIVVTATDASGNRSAPKARKLVLR